MINEIKLFPFKLILAIVINSIIGILISITLFYYGLSYGMGGIYYLSDHLLYLFKIVILVIIYFIYNIYRYKKIKSKELKYNIFMYIISSLFVVASPIVCYFFIIN